jgi:hypothetical protein
MWEKVRHMRAIWLTLFLAACAHQPPPRATFVPEEEKAAPAPVEEAWVRVVAKRPAHGKFVGKVRVVSSDLDFVEAAKVARAKLAARAEKLGADVVKIERLDTTARGRVLIAGRAYRLAR